MAKTAKYYTLKNILKNFAHYYMIYGERSNGKTYSVLEYALDRYLEDGSQLAIIRRFDTDFVGPQSMKTCYNSLGLNGDGVNVIQQKTNGKYTSIQYYAGAYYLAYFDGEREVRSDECVALAFALTQFEHYKSASYPRIRTILFDEFMTRTRYLVDEFIIFQNMISTIVRQRNDVTIFMCANTVNKYGCPYFNEMGLTRIKDMKQGDIDIYTYGQSALRVAVEFSDSPSKSKPSDVYFAFDNPRLQMITGNGCVWEMDIYPHCPMRYRPADIQFMFFIFYDRELLQCEIVTVSDEVATSTFLYIHRKTTPLKKSTTDLIYSDEYRAEPNHRRNMLAATLPVEKKIAHLFRTDKVFYQDNEVGEIVNSYLMWCKAN